MRHGMKGLAISGLLFSGWLLSGCGGRSDGRLDVAGAATFEGEPIVYGSVVFIPDTAAGHKGPTGLAQVTNGRYDTRQEGSQGVLPGKHIIRVTAYPSAPVHHEDETVEVTQVEPLFVNWEITADLKSATFDIVVPADARGFKPAGSAHPGRSKNEP